jgi:hypothetical protein
MKVIKSKDLIPGQSVDKEKMDLFMKIQQSKTFILSIEAEDSESNILNFNLKSLCAYRNQRIEFLRKHQYNEGAVMSIEYCNDNIKKLLNL